MLSGLNVATQVGEGQANVLNWNNTDKAIALLNQQEQQRIQMGYRDYMATQNGLQKEFANVRAADVPEISQLYQQQKQLHQDLLFDKRLHRDPTAFAEKQAEAKQAETEFWNHVNASKEAKGILNNTAQDYRVRPNNYDPTAPKLLSQAVQTPTSKWGDIGFSPDKLLYGGPGNGFQKLITSALGQGKTFDIEEGNTPDGLNRIVNTYKGYNPQGIYNGILNGAATNKGGQDLTWLADNTPQSQIDLVNQQFADKIKNLPPKIKEQLGFTGDDITQVNPLDPKSQIASYLAKQAFLNNPPTSTKTQQFLNKKDEMLLQDKLIRGRYHPPQSASSSGQYNDIATSLFAKIPVTQGKYAASFPLVQAAPDEKSAVLEIVKMNVPAKVKDFISPSNISMGADEQGNYFAILNDQPDQRIPIDRKSLLLIANANKTEKEKQPIIIEGNVPKPKPVTPKPKAHKVTDPELLKKLNEQ